MPGVYEYGGHLWAYRHTDEGAPGDGTIVAEDDSDAPGLAVTHARVPHGRILVSSGSTSLGVTSMIGVSSGNEILLGPDDHTVRVEVRRGLTDHSELAVSFYERVD